MPELIVVEEKPMSMAEVKEFLEEKKKEKKELNFRENKSLVYINSFIKAKSKEAENIKKDLEKLEITRLKDKHIIKIIDMVPKSVDELKVILSGEELTLKSEDLNKIIEVINKYA